MIRVTIIASAILALSGCDRGAPATSRETLTEARDAFETQLTRREAAHEPVPKPPPGIFKTVRFQSQVGKLAAYLSPDPGDGKQRPAIIWITGGDCNTIGDVWSNAPANNDQSARAFRNAGVVMMFPSLRGGNENPGAKEGFYGEVDDVLAAFDFLAEQPYVDPQRIYLGGHSTGGTLVMLVAACSERFRAAFSFGPAEDISGYGAEFMPFNARDKRELQLRSPKYWLHSIKCPLFVFEGTKQPGNLRALQTMSHASANPLVHFYPVSGANHFSILAPTTQLIASKVLNDTGPATNLAFDDGELRKPFSR